MTGAEALIPLVTVTTLFSTIFGIWYLRSKENMALIDRGINPRQNQALPKPFGNLKYGMLLIGAGIGLFLAFMMDIYMVHPATTHPGGHTIQKGFEPLYLALIALGGGAGLVISYVIERKAWDHYARKLAD